MAIVWLAAIDYGNLAGEWVIGGIEGKVPAFGFVLLALAQMVQRRWQHTWILSAALRHFMSSRGLECGCCYGGVASHRAKSQRTASTTELAAFSRWPNRTLWAHPRLGVKRRQSRSECEGGEDLYFLSPPTPLGSVQLPTPLVPSTWSPDPIHARSGEAIPSPRSAFTSGDLYSLGPGG